MQKKILIPTFIFLLSSVFLGAHQAKALIVIHVLYISIHEHTVGSDGTFNFYVQTSNPPDPTLHPVDNFSLSTGDGDNSYSLYGNMNTPALFYITQDQVVGWQSPIIVCTSSNPLVTWSPIDHGVLIQGQDFSSIDCDVTNTKVSKTPVLIIPGVLGTDMWEGTDKLWLDIGHNISDIGDQFMDPLQFNSDLTPANADIHLGDVISKISSLLGFGGLDYTDGLVKEFQDQGYTQGTTTDSNLFLFPYDWRYGVSEDTVNKLKQKIQDIRTQTGSDKIDIVAHSTGGLLVKKYAMENQIDNHIGKAVFVGVPNTGAPKAIKVLLQGDDFGNPFLADSEMKKLAKNFPVVYDLAPSEQYYNIMGSYVKIIDQSIFTSSSHDLNFAQTNDFLTTDHALNSQALVGALNLHTVDFDNFDLRTAGVDLYAIDGCKAGTLGKVIEHRYRNIFGNTSFVKYDNPQIIPGDGTVPLESATNLPIDSAHKYFALKSDHGKMLSQNDIRQEIVNLISGSNLSVSSSAMTQDIAKCKLNGKAISIFSPVSIEVVDQNGNHSGMASDGGIYNDIPNADFEIMGDHKFIYLPTDEGQTYNIKIAGTGNGTFTLKNATIVDNQVSGTDVFSTIPVTTNLKGILNIGTTTTMSLDTNGDGVTDTTLAPSSTVNASQSQDFIPPVTTTNVVGTMGQSDFYRSSVSVSLEATDPVVDNNPEQTSEVFKINYALDGTGYQTYTHTPISVSNEGPHILKFFSTDKAGNNEEEQSISFTIDTIPPELQVTFSTTTQSIEFIGTDDSGTTTMTTSTSYPTYKKNQKESENENHNVATTTTTARDEAGNTTSLIYTKKSQPPEAHDMIKLRSLAYNGATTTIPMASLSYEWENSKKGVFQEFESQLRTASTTVESQYQLKKNITTIMTRVHGLDNSDYDDLNKHSTKQIVSGMVIPYMITKEGKVIINY